MDLSMHKIVEPLFRFHVNATVDHQFAVRSSFFAMLYQLSFGSFEGVARRCAFQTEVIMRFSRSGVYAEDLDGDVVRNGTVNSIGLNSVTADGRNGVFKSSSPYLAPGLL